MRFLLMMRRETWAREPHRLPLTPNILRTPSLMNSLRSRSPWMLPRWALLSAVRQWTWCQKNLIRHYPKSTFS